MRAQPLEFRELEVAVQRLRDAIHAMAQAPAGPKRTQAIKDANNVLLRTHQAMAGLPLKLLTADRLQPAAQNQRDAAHALSDDKASDRRNESMKRINKALLGTQQTMTDASMASGR